MDISKLKAKPQLIKITLDSEEIVNLFEEPVEFYTWDKQPLDLFLQMASADPNNQSELITVMSKMILDSKGEPVITDDTMIPVEVLVAAMTKLTEELGKS